MWIGRVLVLCAILCSGCDNKAAIAEALKKAEEAAHAEGDKNLEELKQGIQKSQLDLTRLAEVLRQIEQQVRGQSLSTATVTTLAVKAVGFDAAILNDQPLGRLQAKTLRLLFDYIIAVHDIELQRGKAHRLLTMPMVKERLTKRKATVDWSLMVVERKEGGLSGRLVHNKNKLDPRAAWPDTYQILSMGTAVDVQPYTSGTMTTAHAIPIEPESADRAGLGTKQIQLQARVHIHKLVELIDGKESRVTPVRGARDIGKELLGKL